MNRRTRLTADRNRAPRRRCARYRARRRRNRCSASRRRSLADDDRRRARRPSSSLLDLEPTSLETPDAAARCTGPPRRRTAVGRRVDTRSATTLEIDDSRRGDADVERCRRSTSICPTPESPSSRRRRESASTSARAAPANGLPPDGPGHSGRRTARTAARTVWKSPRSRPATPVVEDVRRSPQEHRNRGCERKRLRARIVGRLELVEDVTISAADDWRRGVRRRARSRDAIADD